MIEKVISGGQTGVDQAALRAAKTCGIPTGGTAPRGWRTQAGPAPWLADYGLVEHESGTYPLRTEANVRGSDQTLWYGDPRSPGGRLTLRLCLKHNKPCTVVKRGGLTPQEAYQLIRSGEQGQLLQVREFAVLNVSGNREESFPGIGAEAEAWLAKLFTLLKED